MEQNVTDTLSRVGGSALGTLALLDSLRSPGGFGQALQQTQAARLDPETRQLLGQSPFARGLYFVPTRREEQPITGTPPLLPGAAGTVSRIVPNLPPLSTAQQVQSQLTQRVLSRLGTGGGDLDEALTLPLPGGGSVRVGGKPGQELRPGEELVVDDETGLIFAKNPESGGLRKLGQKRLPPPSAPLDPTIQAVLQQALRGATPPGGAAPPSRLGAPGQASTAGGLKLAGLTVSGTGKPSVRFAEETPEKPVSDTILRAWATGVDPIRGGASATPEQKATGKRFVKGLERQAVSRTTAQAMAKPPSERVADELGTINTIDTLSTKALALLDDPQVKHRVGVVAGRVGFGLYRAGLSTFPLEEEFTTLRELIRVMAVGRLARAAGSRSYLVWQELDRHPPQAGDSEQLLRSKLNTIRAVLQETAKNATAAVSTPRSRLGTLVPPGEGIRGLPGPNAPATPAPGTVDLGDGFTLQMH